MMRWSILDLIYMTVITVATIGFKEVAPLSKPSRVAWLLMSLNRKLSISLMLSPPAEIMICWSNGSPGSRLDGKRLNQSNIRIETGGAMVIGIGRPNERREINPFGNTEMKGGYMLLTMGTGAQHDVLRKMAG